MTVIDIRNIFSDRNIEIADVTPSYVYYAEEKNNATAANCFYWNTIVPPAKKD